MRPSPLLTPELADQARRVGALVRAGEAAALIGAGVSIRVYLPNWTALVNSIVLRWRALDRSPTGRGLPDDDYVQMIREVFGDDDRAIIAYLRRVVDGVSGVSFSGLISDVVYDNPAAPGARFTPQPDSVHQWLCAIFRQRPRQLWTTNYDDLLEAAAALNGDSAHTVDPDHRRLDGHFAVTHLHGFLAPPDRRAAGYDPVAATVILAEDDYTRVSNESVGWINREFHNLFDQRRVVIFGMSLVDPNLRRAITTVEARAASSELTHFAVVKRMDIDHDRRLGRYLARWHAETRQALGRRANPTRRVRFPQLPGVALEHYRTATMNDIRAAYWRQRNIELVELPDHGSILPWVTRAQYEAFGQHPGDLWREGVAIGYDAIAPWDAATQRQATRDLDRYAEALRHDDTLPPGPYSDLVEIGVFLITGDGTAARPFELELVFRGGSGVAAKEPHRRFRLNHDAPQGLAGFVFVTGQLVRLPTSDPLHNFNLPRHLRGGSTHYAGILSAPLIDWEAGGVPLGVVYATVARDDGALFRIPTADRAQPGGMSLENFYFELVKVTTNLVKGSRR